MGLRRELNLFDAVMMVVGNIVGVGIFTTSGIVAQYIQHPIWMLGAWAVGGLVALAGALTLGELGACLPRAGGDYAFLREAYHPQVAFLYGWACFWATFSGSIAILAIALADYLSIFFPRLSLQNTIINWPITISGGHLLAISAIIVLCLFNYLGLKPGRRLQNILSVLKIALIAGIIWLGLSSPLGYWGNFKLAATTTAGFGLLAFCQGLVPVWFTYSGWNSITYLGEEVKSPGRNIPLSAAMAVLISLILYLLLNVVYIYAMSTSGMSGVIRVAQLAIELLRGNLAAGLVSAVVALSILGCLNATIIVGARIYYAMAQDGLFFAGWGEVHPRHGSPGTATLGQGMWACVLIVSGTFAQLLNFVVFVMLILSALTGAGLFRLRSARPDLPRPYKVWGYPFTPLIFIIFCLGVALGNLIQEPIQAAWGIAVILTGLPAYRLWQRKP